MPHPSSQSESQFVLVAPRSMPLLFLTSLRHLVFLGATISEEISLIHSAS